LGVGDKGTITEKGLAWGLQRWTASRHLCLIRALGRCLFKTCLFKTSLSDGFQPTRVRLGIRQFTRHFGKTVADYPYYHMDKLDWKFFLSQWPSNN
jgi:hypothetical protein